MFTYRALVFTAFTCALAPCTAHAYCVLYTCQDVKEADVERDPDKELHTCAKTDGCISEGEPLFWESPCLTYGVSELNLSSLGLSGKEFDAIVEEAFEVWQGVDCGRGKHPGFDVRSVGVVESNGVFTCEAEPYGNLAVWSFVTRWTRAANAMAFTSSAYDKKSGQVFDADVDFHLSRFINEVAPEDWTLVTSKVALHEAGHYLGLAHSQVPNAAMEDGYDPLELVSHELTRDDVEAICALYPPDDDLDCSPPGFVAAGLDEDACDEVAAAPRKNAADNSGGGCNLAAGKLSPTGWWVTSLVVALVVGVARRGRRRRSSVTSRR